MEQGVELLLSMREDRQALDKAVQSGDTDLGSYTCDAEDLATAWSLIVIAILRVSLQHAVDSAIQTCARRLF